MIEEIRIGRIFILVSQNLITLMVKIGLCLVFSYHVFPDRIQRLTHVVIQKMEDCMKAHAK